MAQAACSGKPERDPRHRWRIQGRYVKGTTNYYICANCKGAWYKTPDEEA